MVRDFPKTSWDPNAANADVGYIQGNQCYSPGN